MAVVLSKDRPEATERCDENRQQYCDIGGCSCVYWMKRSGTETVGRSQYVVGFDDGGGDTLESSCD